MISGCLAGKVVVITGAGRGIGREIALLAGAEGAKVVVNDVGVSIQGSDPHEAPANSVVDEIRAAGGEAIVSFESVTDPSGAERTIATAVKTFGRLDGVVNNAGILRDRIFHKMSVDDWRSVIEVHLTGSFFMAKAASAVFKEQQSGSFVHMTSGTGLFGNMGQANYGAAKAGLLGLSKAIAIDMGCYNVRSNCVSPTAWSRMTEGVKADTPERAAQIELWKTMSPAKIAPMVVFLLSDLARDVNGQIFAVRKNEIILISQPRPLRSVHRSEGWSPQSIASHLLPALKPDFYPLDTTAEVFPWDPI